MNGILDKLKSLFRTAQRERDGGAPVATAPGDADRETSTNAQVQGAVGQPWSDDE